MSDNMQNTQSKPSKSRMAIKYGAIGVLLAAAPVILAAEILMPMLSVR
ncbi:hypothetical protein [Thiomicrorhabdus cannonii]|nr:hypothetical protein [Thiomicrorhabdus cannonii]